MGLVNRLDERWNKRIVISRYVLKTPKLQASESLRILQVSDLQSTEFGPRCRRLLTCAAAARPDLILITGDLLDRGHLRISPALDAAAGLRRIAPAYYVNGNHEADLPNDLTARFYSKLEEIGVRTLFDRAEDLKIRGEGVRLIGLSEEAVFRARGQKTGTGRKVRPKACSYRLLQAEVYALLHERGCGFGMEDKTPLPKSRINLLMTHEPQIVPHITAPGIDLAFAGHAHGGQFRLPGGQGLFAPNQGVLPRFTEGIHTIHMKQTGGRTARTSLVISRGLGNSKFPFRLNNPPELVVIDLRG